MERTRKLVGYFSRGGKTELYSGRTYAHHAPRNRIHWNVRDMVSSAATKILEYNWIVRAFDPFDRDSETLIIVVHCDGGYTQATDIGMEYLRLLTDNMSLQFNLCIPVSAKELRGRGYLPAIPVLL